MSTRGTVVLVGLLAGLAAAFGQSQPSPFRPPLSGAESTTPPPGTLRESPAPPVPGALFLTQPASNTLLATDYIGRAVYGPGQQKVGAINNLIVDTTGRVVGIVIDIGGFLGFGSKEVAIAFEALYPVMEEGKEAFVVEVSKPQLSAAPRFKRRP